MLWLFEFYSKISTIFLAFKIKRSFYKSLIRHIVVRKKLSKRIGLELERKGYI
jgi:hypothetical protein